MYTGGRPAEDSPPWPAAAVVDVAAAASVVARANRYAIVSDMIVEYQAQAWTKVKGWGSFWPGWLFSIGSMILMVPLMEV